MENRLPLELESDYTQYQHYFDHWNIQIKDGETNFYLIGKWQFKVGEGLTKEEILRHMNLFELIYKGAFEAGVRETQGKIKSALGMCN